MKTLFSVVLAAALLVPAIALGQLNVSLTLPLPPVPPLVVVSPGIQVVENFQDEVFVQGGIYWARRDGTWYRAESPKATFVKVEPKVVPVELTKIPPGHYKHWKKVKEQEKAERKAEKAQEHHDKGEKKGHGKGKH